MAFNLNDSKFGTNSLINDYNSNYIMSNECGSIQKENDLEEINDFQKFFNSNDKLIDFIQEDIPEKKHQEVAEEGLARFDLNGNGTIEFNEFYEFINFLVAEKGYSL